MPNGFAQPSKQDEATIDSASTKADNILSKIDKLSPADLKLSLKEFSGVLSKLKESYSGNENAAGAMEEWVQKLKAARNSEEASSVLNEVKSGLADLKAGGEITPAESELASTTASLTPKAIQGEAEYYAGRVIGSFGDYIRSPSIQNKAVLDNRVSEYRQAVTGGQMENACNELISRDKLCSDLSIENIEGIANSAANVSTTYARIQLAMRAQTAEDFAAIVGPTKQAEASSNGSLYTDNRYRELAPLMCESIYGDRGALDKALASLSDPAFLKARADFLNNADYADNALFSLNVQKVTSDDIGAFIEQGKPLPKYEAGTDILAQYAFFTYALPALAGQKLDDVDTVKAVIAGLAQIPEGGREAFLRDALPAIINRYPDKVALRTLMGSCIAGGSYIANDMFGASADPFVKNNLGAQNELLRFYYSNMVPNALDRVDQNRGLAMLENARRYQDPRDFSLKDPNWRYKDVVTRRMGLGIRSDKPGYGFNPLPTDARTGWNFYNKTAFSLLDNLRDPSINPTNYVDSVALAASFITDLSQFDNRFYHSKFGYFGGAYESVGRWSSVNTPTGTTVDTSTSSNRFYADLLGPASNLRASGDWLKNEAGGTSDTNLGSVRASGQNLSLMNLLPSTIRRFSIEEITDKQFTADLEQSIALSGIEQGPGYETAKQAVNFRAYYRKNHADGTYEGDILIRKGRDWTRVNVRQITPEEMEQIYANVHYDSRIDGRAKKIGEDLKAFSIAANTPEAVGFLKDISMAYINNKENADQTYFAASKDFGKTNIMGEYYEDKKTEDVTISKPPGEVPQNSAHALSLLFQSATAVTNEDAPNTDPEQANQEVIIFRGAEFDFLISQLNTWKLYGIPTSESNQTPPVMITPDQGDELINYANSIGSGNLTLKQMFDKVLEVAFAYEPDPGGEVTKTIETKIRSVALVARNANTEAALALGLKDKEAEREGAAPKQTDKSALFRHWFGPAYGKKVPYMETAAYRSLKTYVENIGGEETLSQIKESGYSGMSAMDMLGFVAISHIENTSGEEDLKTAKVKLGKGYVAQASNYENIINAAQGSTASRILATALSSNFGRLEIIKSDKNGPDLEEKGVGLNTNIYPSQDLTLGATVKGSTITVGSGKRDKTEFGGGVIWTPRNLSLRLSGMFSEDSAGTTETGYTAGVGRRGKKYDVNLLSTGFLKNAPGEKTSHHELGLYGTARSQGELFVVVSNENKTFQLGTRDELKLTSGLTYFGTTSGGANYKLTFSGGLKTIDQLMEDLRDDTIEKFVTLTYYRNNNFFATIEYGAGKTEHKEADATKDRSSGSHRVKVSLGMSF
ncbi:MAG: hypothetical protein ABIF01_05705 [Candidatus Micrarchaeota archaeon]